MKTDRDPEAEAEDKVEEEKLPGAEEEGVPAIESGFAATGGDWEAPAAGFAGAQAAGWDDAAAPVAAGDNWGATGQPAANWSDEAAPKDAAAAQW